MFVLTRRHGEVVSLGTGASSAAEAFSLGGHVGTHFDALCHFAKDGRIHGGRLASGGLRLSARRGRATRWTRWG